MSVRIHDENVDRFLTPKPLILTVLVGIIWFMIAKILG
jgi:hypothetical protein